MTEEELMNKKVAEASAIYGEAPKIDLSKIKNAEAAKVSGELKEKITASSKKQKKNKFCFTEEHVERLPTGGLLYQDFEDEEVRNGEITIRPMSLVDEEILTNQGYIKNGTVFIKLLENCVVNNIDVSKLSPYDVFYLLYSLRKITYGEDYRFDITCECGKKYETTIDISEVEWQELTKEDNVKSVVTLKLPVSKFTVTIEMSTLGNESESYKLAKKYSDAGEVVLNYIVRTREVLDDKGEPINPDDYADFFEALPGKDRAQISKAFEKIDNLEIPKAKVVCPKCGKEEEVAIPFNKEFFRY